MAGRKNVQDVYIQQRNGALKLGIAKNTTQRHRTFTTASPSPIHVIGVVPDGKRELEQWLHQKFARFNIDRENVGTEWFRPHPSLLWWVFVTGLRHGELWIPKPTVEFMWAVFVTTIKDIMAPS